MSNINVPVGEIEKKIFLIKTIKKLCCALFQFEIVFKKLN